MLPNIRMIGFPSERFATFGASIAAASYSLYLTHRPALSLINTVLPRQQEVTSYTVSLFLARIAFCLLVAMVFYYLFLNSGKTRKY